MCLKLLSLKSKLEFTNSHTSESKDDGDFDDDSEDFDDDHDGVCCDGFTVVNL